MKELVHAWLDRPLSSCDHFEGWRGFRIETKFQLSFSRDNEYL